MKGIRDKVQPWCRPNLTGNKSDLLQALRTKLWHRLYRDQTGIYRASNTPSGSTHLNIPHGIWLNIFTKYTKHNGWVNSLAPLWVSSWSIHCSKAKTKTTLLLPNLRFDFLTDPSLQLHGIDFTEEAQDCDPFVVGTHPLVPFLKKMDRQSRGTVPTLNAMLQRCITRTAPHHPEPLGTQSGSHLPMGPPLPQRSFYPPW